MGIWVLRLGHRRVRDQRITSHCALVARAFGADGITYSGDKDENLEKSIKKVVDKWGGPFEVKYEKNWKKVIENFSGVVIHLTMYGELLNNVIHNIKKTRKNKLILIGAEKVSSIVFKMSTWNVAVGNQPHSEVSALAVFLDHLLEGKSLKKKFRNVRIKVIPSKRGKIVKEIS